MSILILPLLSSIVMATKRVFFQRNTGFGNTLLVKVRDNCKDAVLLCLNKTFAILQSIL
jgi:hypothetical protein